MSVSGLRGVWHPSFQQEQVCGQSAGGTAGAEWSIRVSARNSVICDALRHPGLCLSALIAQHFNYCLCILRHFCLFCRMLNAPHVKHNINVDFQKLLAFQGMKSFGLECSRIGEQWVKLNHLPFCCVFHQLLRRSLPFLYHLHLALVWWAKLQCCWDSQQN